MMSREIRGQPQICLQRVKGVQINHGNTQIPASPSPIPARASLRRQPTCSSGGKAPKFPWPISAKPPMSPARRCTFTSPTGAICSSRSFAMSKSAALPPSWTASAPRRRASPPYRRWPLCRPEPIPTSGPWRGPPTPYAAPTPLSKKPAGSAARSPRRMQGDHQAVGQRGLLAQGPAHERCHGPSLDPHLSPYVEDLVKQRKWKANEYEDQLAHLLLNAHNISSWANGGASQIEIGGASLKRPRFSTAFGLLP